MGQNAIMVVLIFLGVSWTSLGQEKKPTTKNLPVLLRDAEGGPAKVLAMGWLSQECEELLGNDLYCVKSSVAVHRAHLRVFCGVVNLTCTV